ncbi:MAG: hypothetical protein AAF696_07885, partial [Bacteroidota bacterium]
MKNLSLFLFLLLAFSSLDAQKDSLNVDFRRDISILKGKQSHIEIQVDSVKKIAGINAGKILAVEKFWDNWKWLMGIGATLISILTFLGIKQMVKQMIKSAAEKLISERLANEIGVDKGAFRLAMKEFTKVYVINLEARVYKRNFNLVKGTSILVYNQNFTLRFYFIFLGKF